MTPASRLLHRLFRRDDPSDRAVDRIVGELDVYLTWAARLTLLSLGVAGVLAALLILGEHHGLFSALAPATLHSHARVIWLDRTYVSWWASTSHSAGLAVYFAVAAFGLYIVILQNIVGGACIYFIAVLPSIATFDADWLNRDGHYGWSVIGELFRTVYLSLMLHGVTLCMILVAVGPAHYLWIILLVAIWAVGAPTYLLVPIRVFGKVDGIAKERRFRQINRELSERNLDTASPVAETKVYSEEIARVHATQIRPLRLRQWSLRGLVVSVFLPVGIAIAQELAH
jgi:hypothetical protein